MFANASARSKRQPRRRRAAMVALVASLTTVAFAADASAGGSYDKYTFMLSSNSGKGMPNGPSRNAAISQDGRFARVAAFESDASNIVSGDTNRQTDIFAVLRAPGYDSSGSPWREGSRRLITRSPSGQPANGPSYKPVLDGNSDDAPPKCIAFVSAASNLVSGDTNGKPDAFVYSISSRTIKRVSVGSSGQQSNGITYDVSIDGLCQRVSFTSSAQNLALTSTSKSQWKSAVTDKPRLGTKQVYYRFIEEPKYSSSGLRGLTFLASATNGKSGNGHSWQTTMPSRRGDAVGFTSRAKNLSSSDKNNFTDVYWRQLPLVRKSGVSGLTPELKTNLISRGRSGGAGNGDSSAPVASGNQVDSSSGQFIAFQTLSTNVGGGFTDSNQVSDVVRANLNGNSLSTRYLSNGEGCRVLGNGPSQRPTISEAGSTIMFDTDASNFKCASGGDQNGSIADVFTWTEKRQGGTPFSRDSNEAGLGLDSRNPATSARINYHMWETRDPYADIALAQRMGYGFDSRSKAAMRQQAAGDERFQQVYLRYAGPA